MEPCRVIGELARRKAVCSPSYVQDFTEDSLRILQMNIVGRDMHGHACDRRLAGRIQSIFFYLDAMNLPQAMSI